MKAEVGSIAKAISVGEHLGPYPEGDLGKLLREASSPKSRAFSAFRSSGSVRLAGREVGVSVFLICHKMFCLV